jgi:hypothetical protein
MLQRMNRNLPTEMTKLARPVAAYLRENVHYTLLRASIFRQRFST